jgi:hypothetical protein
LTDSKPKAVITFEIFQKGTLAGARVDARRRSAERSLPSNPKPDPGQALAMLKAFASVGATAFDLSLTDIEETGKVFQPKCSLDELRYSVSKRLEAAEQAQYNVIIRPRSTTALLVQLDDFDEGRAARMEPYAFMTVHTSPGNYQVWLAADGPKENEKDAAKQFRTRVRKGAGADKSATGATRIAGSLNFKKKYAPSFPMVAVCKAHEGRVTTTAALGEAGLIAPEQPRELPPRDWQRGGDGPTIGNRLKAHP